jgi:hypothetical protein
MRLSKKELESVRWALDALSAYRLLQVMSWQEAKDLTKAVYGRPLFEDKEGWDHAKIHTEAFIATTRPKILKAMIELGGTNTLPPLSLPLSRAEWDFSKCPDKELFACWQYELAREAARVGKS